MTGRLTILKCFFDSKIISRCVKCIDNDVIYKVHHKLTGTSFVKQLMDKDMICNQYNNFEYAQEKLDGYPVSILLDCKLLTGFILSHFQYKRRC